MEHLLKPILDWAAQLPRGFTLIREGDPVRASVRFELWREGDYEALGTVIADRRVFAQPTNEIRRNVLVVLGELRTLYAACVPSPPLEEAG